MRSLLSVEGQLPKYPVDFASLERKAAETLPSWVYSYVAGGCGDEGTQRANVDAFSRYAIVPRMLVGATERDLSVSLCSDVAKALALGATAVGIGRPYAYALAVGGTDGVVAQLRAILAELDLLMAIDGFPTLADLRAAGAQRI